MGSKSRPATARRISVTEVHLQPAKRREPIFLTRPRSFERDLVLPSDSSISLTCRNTGEAVRFLTWAFYPREFAAPMSSLPLARLPMLALLSVAVAASAACSVICMSFGNGIRVALMSLTPVQREMT